MPTSEDSSCGMFSRVGSDVVNMTLVPLPSGLCPLHTWVIDHRIISAELVVTSKLGDHMIYYANQDTFESEGGHD